MKRLLIGSFVFILALLQGASLSQSAFAENIPILIWERGQTQNVVLGAGTSNQEWKIYLVSDQKSRLPFTSSIKNKDGFYVYSIDLSDSLRLGGYVIEAISAQGESKQVAGIQIIAPAVKAITRVPNELLFLLSGFSLFLFLLNQIKVRGIAISNLTEPSTEGVNRENLFTRKLRFWVTTTRMILL
jgi:hypothetical protein